MFTPGYQISPALLRTIKQITVLVHELNKRQPPQVAMAHLLHEAQVTSAFASTSIEGNPLPLTEVRRLLKSQPATIRQSEREVLNYNRALIWLHERLNRPLTTSLVREIHHRVMAGLLPKAQIGQWRQEPVVIHNPRNGEIVYAPPDHGAVPELMDALVAFVAAERATLDPLLLAGLFHKQFVVIHPFVDGNGRTVRLATNLLLAGLGVNLFQLLSFENYYNQNVTRYFQAVGVFGDYYDRAASLDFTPWLEYFAEGILDELLRVEQQLTPASPREPAAQLAAHHHHILETIDRQGFITDRDYAGLTERAKATRSLDFRKLIDLGLIVRKGRGRSIYYQRAQPEEQGT
jgi:Fic family protein